MVSTSVVNKLGVLAASAAVAAACTPYFATGSVLELRSSTGTTVRIVWHTAYDAEFDGAGHSISYYEIRVDGVVVESPSFAVASCTIDGLASGTTYDIEVVAVSDSGEASDDLPGGLGRLSAQYTTPAGSDPGGPMSCPTETDTDGDRLPDWTETDTGVFVDETDTGTDPHDPDTDGDAINDGDEVVGTVNGLPLPQLGSDPLKINLFVEFDWMDDDQDCGSHTHRPTAAVIDRFEQAFADAPVTNPDGSTGIDVVSDRGQGGFFGHGARIDDTIAPIGSINGGVNGAEYQAIKAANFHPSREGYFHYVVMMHTYNTASTSSGQAELPGDDNIVSMRCLLFTDVTANTIMHELGHNLSLQHGGDVGLPNHKPNYNSVMNYRFQFTGVDADSGVGGCDSIWDGIIDYSDGDRPPLDELALVEADGVCGSPWIDWDGDTILDHLPYARDINVDLTLTGDGLFQVLTDHDDWGSLDFDAVDDLDGARFGPPRLIDEQPVPLAPSGG